MLETNLYVNFLSMLTRPGEPRAAASVGQNFCHRKAVKCGFVWTLFGSADVTVSMHSVRNSVPGDAADGPPSQPRCGDSPPAAPPAVGSTSRLHSHCSTGITSL